MPRVKPILDMRDCAELAGLYKEDGEPNVKLIKRRLANHPDGILFKMPGMPGKLFIGRDDLQAFYPRYYEEAVRNSRYWEQGCPHPARGVTHIHSGVRWCAGCGGVSVLMGAWQLPRSAEP